MPSSKPYIKAYLTHEERTQVERQAEKAGLSVLKFVVAACLELDVTSIVDQQAGVRKKRQGTCSAPSQSYEKYLRPLSYRLDFYYLSFTRVKTIIS